MVNSMTNIPSFVKREIEKLEEMTQPITKKAYRFIFWAYPLIFISLINLLIILFYIPPNEVFSGSIIFYALLGAFGFALSKEAKLQRKEILKLSLEYMINRIRKSDVASDHLKNEYISLVKQHPNRSMQHFVEFLKKENKLSYYS